jgi:hypothetical protein
MGAEEPHVILITHHPVLLLWRTGSARGRFCATGKEDGGNIPPATPLPLLCRGDRKMPEKV